MADAFPFLRASQSSVKVELERIKAEYKTLAERDEGSRKNLQMQLETVALKALHGDSQRFIDELRQVSFYPMYAGGHSYVGRQRWEEAKSIVVGLIDSMEHSVDFADSQRSLVLYGNSVVAFACGVAFTTAITTGKALTWLLTVVLFLGLAFTLGILPRWSGSLKRASYWATLVAASAAVVGLVWQITHTNH